MYIRRSWNGPAKMVADMLSIFVESQLKDLRFDIGS